MKVPKARRLPSGEWFIQLRLGGVSYPVTAHKESQCVKQAQLIKAEYLAGKKIEKQKKACPTLEQAIDAYIEARRPVLSPSTIRGYQTIKNNRFRAVAEKPLDQITNWQTLVSQASKDLSPKTVKNDWGFIVSVLRENGIAPPPVQLPQLLPPEKAYLDPEQIRRFVELVRDAPCCIPALLALQSRRRSEILGLDWASQDLEAEIIHVRGAAVMDEANQLVRKPTNKNQSSRRDVPMMIPALVEALQKVPPAQRKGPVVKCNPNTIWAQINRLCERNGLPKVGVHGLRHSFASLAFSSDVGMTEREVQEIGGWADAHTVHKIYEHLSHQNRIKAENKMKQFYKSPPPEAQPRDSESQSH